MNIQRIIKPSFVVIGKEGSTHDGPGFIPKLWEDANAHFSEVAHLAKKDDDGHFAGFWGAMSDFSRAFKPWENFSQGLYLAGVECADHVQAPDGWRKWTIPEYEYVYAENENGDTFAQVIRHLEESNLSLAGAVHDFTCPQTGKAYVFFPVRAL